MKYVWEETDIKPTDPAGRSLLGCIVENTNTTATNRYSILGYEYVPSMVDSGTVQQITLTHLDDGSKTTSKSVAGMVTHLNTHGYAPVMEPRRIRFGR